MADEVKLLKNAGYKVILKKAKDRGTRIWMIVERAQKKSIVLVVLAYMGEEGWVAKSFHENHGIPRLNCPLSIFCEIGTKPKNKKAREWRMKAEAMMQKFAERSHQLRLMKKQLRNVPYAEIKKMMV
jgi:hypothetical protein